MKQQLSSADHPPGTSFADAHRMHKLVRCKRTKAFLTKDGAWTHDISKALTISGRDQLDGLPDGFQRHDVEIYYSFGDLEYDFAVPL